VTDIGDLKESKFNQSIDSWDTSNVINMVFMFSESVFNHPIDNWVMSCWSDMYNMLY